MADEEKIYGYKACVPRETKREAVIKTVKNWLESRSEALNRSASSVVAQALAEAYPCAEN